MEKTIPSSTFFFQDSSVVFWKLSCLVHYCLWCFVIINDWCVFYCAAFCSAFPPIRYKTTPSPRFTIWLSTRRTPRPKSSAIAASRPWCPCCDGPISGWWRWCATAWSTWRWGIRKPRYCAKFCFIKWLSKKVHLNHLSLIYFHLFVLCFVGDHSGGQWTTRTASHHENEHLREAPQYRVLCAQGNLRGISQ